MDVRRARSIRGAFDRVDAIVDLATGATVGVSWDQVEADINGRVNILEAARLAGVSRYIFASSNHATGMYELDQPYASIVAGRIRRARSLLDSADQDRLADPARQSLRRGQGVR